MTENFSKIYEKLQRIHQRQNMYRIWKTGQSGETDKLTEQDNRLWTIMLGHEEFHNQFDNAEELVEYVYNPETEVNPFLHISIHQMAEDQLAEEEPVEVALFYERMEAKGCSRHDILHLIGMIIVQITHDALSKQIPFDGHRYRQILKKLATLSPDELPEALDREFNSN